MIKPFATLATAALLALPAAAQEPATAAAILKDKDGNEIGAVSFSEYPQGILVSARLTGLNAEGHGFHIHENGNCAPDFSAAGGHFNPDGKEHGFQNPNGRHLGDLPNIYGGNDGQARVDVMMPGASLTEGAGALLDANGSAVIIHELPDTYGAEAGAGGRLACGVITAAATGN